MANRPVTSYICGGGWSLLLLYFTGDDGDLLSANDFNWMFGCLGCQTDCIVEGVTVSVFFFATNSVSPSPEENNFCIRRCRFAGVNKRL